MKFKVDRLDYNSAKDFLTNQGDFNLGKCTITKIFGLYQQRCSNLMGVMIISLPVKDVYKNIYKNELLKISLLEDMAIPGVVTKFIELVVEKFNLVEFISSDKYVLSASKKNCLDSEFTELKQDGHHFVYWNSPHYKHYTYKIYATDSEKFYLGRKSTRVNNQSDVLNQLMTDNYYGSGGTAFKRWKNKHSKTIKKEVLKVFDTWGESLAHEVEIIGELYKTNKNCLNRITGGSSGFYKRIKDGDITLSLHTYKGYCSIHGHTSHYSGKRCVKCMSENLNKEEVFESKNISSEQNVYCKYTDENNLIVESPNALKESSIGDEFTDGQSDNLKSNFNNKYSIKSKNAFRNNTIAGRKFVDKECKIHGITPFAKDTCIKCSVSGAYSQGSCLLHGKGVSFKNGRCTACVNIKKFSVDYRDCSSHGKESLFVDNVCLKCFMDSNEDFKVMFDSASVAPKHNYFYVCSRCGKDKITIKPGDFAHDSIALVDKQGKLPVFWQRNFCFDCEKAFSFWDKTIELRKLKTFIVDLGLIVPPVVNKKRFS